ncbi:alkaline phytoceramidase [Dacryopinax primogenitus]|uniref:Alkaline phytoceramidase n=1 Tax=Dacryopinax primogenitus (strain DJM 731) TaxID=1858805 RepID=M5FN86_DACPD|nr:alkaline phytoceramidase [Dacryopinax primogenitus]EJT97010.1 alkaline phytoceramidase [Dacryopinax primogenitus]
MWPVRQPVTPVHREGQKTFGYWGPHTSSIDWCEDNYVNLPYIAETWNTFSNIPYMLLGLHGVLLTQGLPHRARFALLHAGVALIGVGSFIFHATLNWYAQVFLDELPMIYVSTLCLYVILMAGKDAWWKRLVAPALVMLALAVTVIYFWYPNPVFHQLSYAFIQFLTTARNYVLLQTVPPSVRKQCHRILWSGAITFLLGFAIWNVDNQFCDTLTQYRGHYGDVVGALTQGHAWWHVLTGIGGSRIVVGVTYLALCVEDPDGYEIGTSLGCMPYVRAKAKVSHKKAE